MLRHLSRLGLQVDWEKSKLSPVQSISFPRICQYDSASQERAHSVDAELPEDGFQGSWVTWRHQRRLRLEFGPAYSQWILRPRPGDVPEVPTTPFRDQVLACKRCLGMRQTQPYYCCVQSVYMRPHAELIYQRLLRAYITYRSKNNHI